MNYHMRQEVYCGRKLNETILSVCVPTIRMSETYLSISYFCVFLCHMPVSIKKGSCIITRHAGSLIVTEGVAYMSKLKLWRSFLCNSTCMRVGDVDLVGCRLNTRPVKGVGFGRPLHERAEARVEVGG